MKLDFASSNGFNSVNDSSFGKSSSIRKTSRHQAELDEIFEAFRLFSQDTGIITEIKFSRSD